MLGARVNPAWVTAVIALATLVFGILVWLSRHAWRLFSKISDFLEDWNGRPETPARKRVPGAMERLAKLEEGMVNQNSVIDAIKHEVTLNSGGSLKDTVTQILANQAKSRP
jgi:hypothetical protein